MNLRQLNAENLKTKISTEYLPEKCVQNNPLFEKQDSEIQKLNKIYKQTEQRITGCIDIKSNINQEFYGQVEGDTIKQSKKQIFEQEHSNLNNDWHNIQAYTNQELIDTKQNSSQNSCIENLQLENNLTAYQPCSRQSNSITVKQTSTQNFKNLDMNLIQKAYLDAQFQEIQNGNCHPSYTRRNDNRPVTSEIDDSLDLADCKFLNHF